jgi:hypothetical protein
MAPPSNKKRAAAVPTHPDSKRQATVNKKGAKKSPSTTKKPTANTKLSSLGFSSSKRPQYKLGTKLLLDTSIYNDEDAIPEKVVDHLFVYEIVEISENGNTVKILYKNQVIADGGNKFRQYKDSEEAQVSFSSFI